MKINFDQIQLITAATYLHTHNKGIRRYQDSVIEIEMFLHDMMVRTAITNARNLNENVGGWITYTGSGGAMMLFSTEDDETIDVEIYVTPSFSDEGDYRTIDLDEKVGYQGTPGPEGHTTVAPHLPLDTGPENDLFGG